MTFVATINSAAINLVPFPGAEEGLSLVELIGNVEVTCTISAVSIHRQTQAPVVAQAETRATNTTLRTGLGAATTAAANTTVNERMKARVVPSPLVATAATTATATAKLATAAQISAVATAAADIKARQRVGAQVVASAFGVADRNVLVFRTAATVAKATTTAGTRRSILLGATCSPKSTTTAGIKLRAAAFPTAAPTASTIGSVIVKHRIGAQEAASAIAADVAAALICTATPENLVASALGQTTNTLSKIRLVPVFQGARCTAVAGVNLSYRLGATSVAQAAAAAVAIDYSVNMPAPIDRQMIVPEAENQMEVVE